MWIHTPLLVSHLPVEVDKEEKNNGHDSQTHVCDDPGDRTAFEVQQGYIEYDNNKLTLLIQQYHITLLNAKS